MTHTVARPRRSVRERATAEPTPGAPASPPPETRPANADRGHAMRRKVFQIAADGIALSATMALTGWAVVVGGNHDELVGRHVLLGALALPLFLLVFSRYRLYHTRAVSSRLEELGRTVHAIGSSVLLIAFVGAMIQAPPNRVWLVLTGVLGVVVVTVERSLTRWYFRGLRRKGRLARATVVIGGNDEARALVRMVANAPELGHAVVGVVTDGAPDADGTIAGAPILGRLLDATEIVERTQVSTVLLATTALDFLTANKLARDLHDIGVHVELSAGLRDIAPERLTVRGLGRHALIYLEPTVREGWRGKAKRAFDVSFAVTALCLAGPILLVCAALVKLTSKGPVLFRQVRVGRKAEPFQVLKLRTMVADAEDRLPDLRQLNEADGPLFKIRDDPRVTSVGRILRKLSLDELPQLWNVVRGEMSLVGPRPALPSEITGWGPDLANRLRVKPGMTGMWQVNGRSDASFEEYVRLDLYYVDNWTLGTDLAILAKTLPVVLLGRGAS